MTKRVVCLTFVALLLAGAVAGAADYVGSDACLTCHSGVVKKIKASVHGRFVLDADQNPSAIPGDFSGNWSKALGFKKEDVQFVLLPVPGFLTTAELVGRKGTFGVPADDYPVLWASVEFPHGEWIIEGAGTGNGTPWLSTCAGCHVTGLKVPTKDNPTQARRFVEGGIACENCHGPGSDHLADPQNGKLPPVNAATTCGQCHQRGASVALKPDGKTFGYPYSADGRQYVPGDDLAKYYKTSNPKDNPRDWWPTGHARNSHHMQFPEWLASGHAKSLESLKASDHARDSCLECHSSDAIVGEATLKTAQVGLTCQGCHDSHDPSKLRQPEHELCGSCHNAEGPLVPGRGVYHPTLEFYQGNGVPGVAVIPSKHAAAGVTCQDCHMPAVTSNPHKKSHLMKIVTPAEGAKHKMPDSCTPCHKKGAYVGAELARVQSEVKALLAVLQADLDALKARYEKHPSYLEAKLNYDVVIKDGSTGFHNPAYAKALLSAATQRLAALR
jgi:hypothetical protein